MISEPFESVLTLKVPSKIVAVISVFNFGFVCLFVLRFYVPVNPMGSCRVRSVYLTTRLLGRLVLKAVNQYCAHSFARN